MVKKKKPKEPDAANDDVHRGSSGASSSSPDNSNGNLKSLRTNKGRGAGPKSGANKKGASEETANKSNARNPITQDYEPEPMATENVEKPSNEAKANSGSYNDAKRSPHKHHHHEHPFNEDTLNRLKVYLQSDKMHECLDEDAIAVKILKTDTATSERVRFLHDPYADSDEEETTPKQSYQAAEDYTLAMSFYKKVIAETQDEDPDNGLDKRTLNWLQKALGLHRRNELWETTVHEQQEETEESDQDEERSQQEKSKSRRTVTRGMVRSTRIKRRAERKTKESMNLNALLGAVDDLEGEFGPFPESPSSQVGFDFCEFFGLTSSVMLNMDSSCYCYIQQKKRKRDKETDSSDESTENHRPKKKSSHEKPLRSKEQQLKKSRTFDRNLTAYLPQPEKEVNESFHPVRRVSKTDTPLKVRLKLGGKEVRRNPEV